MTPVPEKMGLRMEHQSGQGMVILRVDYVNGLLGASMRSHRYNKFAWEPDLDELMEQMAEEEETRRERDGRP